MTAADRSGSSQGERDGGVADPPHTAVPDRNLANLNSGPSERRFASSVLQFCWISTCLIRTATTNTVLDIVVASFLETDDTNIILGIRTLIDIGEFFAFYKLR